MRRFSIALALAAFVASIVTGLAAGASARGVDSVFIDSNPTCANVKGLSYSNQVKFDPLVNGAMIAGVNLTLDGPRVGFFTTDFPVKAVLVKGGTGANVYVYPFGDTFSDGSLVAPTNQKNGKPYAAQSVIACY
jgi:hypothetical protein